MAGQGGGQRVVVYVCGGRTPAQDYRAFRLLADLHCCQGEQQESRRGEPSGVRSEFSPSSNSHCCSNAGNQAVKEKKSLSGDEIKNGK